MKKIIYGALMITILSFFLYNNDKTIIPKDSIRFRIIANSNDAKDQAIKMNIKKELEKEFFSKLDNVSSKEEAEEIINSNNDTLKKVLDKYNMPYTINYGQNYFPEKNYQGVIYEEGNYDSLVISLGQGMGNNWWCVMYPPLCLLENETEEEPEYSLFIEKIISKFTS